MKEIKELQAFYKLVDKNNIIIQREKILNSKEEKEINEYRKHYKKHESDAEKLWNNFIDYKKEAGFDGHEMECIFYMSHLYIYCKNIYGRVFTGFLESYIEEYFLDIDEHYKDLMRATFISLSKEWEENKCLPALSEHRNDQVEYLANKDNVNDRELVSEYVSLNDARLRRYKCAELKREKARKSKGKVQ